METETKRGRKPKDPTGEPMARWTTRLDVKTRENARFLGAEGVREAINREAKRVRLLNGE
jgi:hypothetical protein